MALNASSDCCRAICQRLDEEPSLGGPSSKFRGHCSLCHRHRISPLARPGQPRIECPSCGDPCGDDATQWKRCFATGSPTDYKSSRHGEQALIIASARAFLAIMNKRS